MADRQVDRLKLVGKYGVDPIDVTRRIVDADHRQIARRTDLLRQVVVEIEGDDPLHRALIQELDLIRRNDLQPPVPLFRLKPQCVQDVDGVPFQDCPALRQDQGDHPPERFLPVSHLPRRLKHPRRRLRLHMRPTIQCPRHGRNIHPRQFGDLPDSGFTLFPHGDLPSLRITYHRDHRISTFFCKYCIFLFILAEKKPRHSLSFPGNLLHYIESRRFRRRSQLQPSRGISCRKTSNRC